MTQAESGGVDREAAVRRYLLFLEDPSSLVDAARISEIEAALASAADPIERLRLYAALERARATDGDSCKLAFILHARQWADENEIPAGAFRQLGVPEEVLVAAGLDGDGGGRRPARGTPKPAPARPRATPVGVAEIQGHIAHRVGTFTLIEVMNAVGGSPMTVRRAIDDLVAQGRLNRLGPDPRHHGRGRAPVVYENP